MATEQIDMVIQQGVDFTFLHEKEDFSSSLLPYVTAEVKLRAGIGGDVVATWTTANGYITKAAHGNHIDFTIFVGAAVTALLSAPSSGVYDMDITTSDGINPTTTVRHAEGAFYITPNV
jgi:hypothetical protein